MNEGKLTMKFATRKSVRSWGLALLSALFREADDCDGEWFLVGPFEVAPLGVVVPLARWVMGL